jgi:colicin import membrane protein
VKENNTTSAKPIQIDLLPLGEIADDRFKHFLTVSLAVHFGLVFFLFIKSFVFPSEPIVFQPAIQVDLLGLPDKLPEDLDVSKKPSPSARPEPAKPQLRPSPPTSAASPSVPSARPTPPPPQAPTVNLDKTRREQSQALNRIEQMAALERLRQQQEQAQSAARAQENTRPQIRGDEISEGTSLRGVARLEHEQYLARLESQIRKAWALPPWLANKNLKARALVRIERDGSLLAAEVIEPSGDPMFDDLVLETIRKVAPFAAPPESITSVLRGRGIVFGFPE